MGMRPDENSRVSEANSRTWVGAVRARRREVLESGSLAESGAPGRPGGASVASVPSFGGRVDERLTVVVAPFLSRPQTRGVTTVPPARARIVGLSLGLFLAAVAVLLLLGLLAKCERERPLADWRQVARELADGDRDGDERQVALRRLLALAASATDDAGRMAGRLAAVALADAAAYERFASDLGGEPGRVPPAAEQRWLDLGDPALGNVLRAAGCEAAGNRAAARQLWQQVAAQARLSGRPFAASLAAAALIRLP
jgi:hypothetical protein